MPVDHQWTFSHTMAIRNASSICDEQHSDPYHQRVILERIRSRPYEPDEIGLCSSRSSMPVVDNLPLIVHPFPVALFPGWPDQARSTSHFTQRDPSAPSRTT
jgi:hypothetical protein